MPEDAVRKQSHMLYDAFIMNSLYCCCRYGEQAANATNEGLDAAGHAVGTAWAALKIRKVLNPKSALDPTTLTKSAVKAAAAEAKAKNSK